MDGPDHADDFGAAAVGAFEAVEVGRACCDLGCVSEGLADIITMLALQCILGMGGKGRRGELTFSSRAVV